MSNTTPDTSDTTSDTTTPPPSSTTDHTALETQIDQWRGFVRRRRAITPPDVEEMEDHLREQVSDLADHGLDDDEAFLVAVKRMGRLDDVSREFAREHSDRLWKQLVLFPGTHDDGTPATPWYRELGVLLALAAGAGLALKILQATTGFETADEMRAVLNTPFLVLPFVAGYFAWKRRLGLRPAAALIGITAALALVVNLYPFRFVDGPYGAVDPAMTHLLTILHTPVVLWFLVGVAYAGGAWRSDTRRMDFVRFTGELLVYLVLIALGGGLLMGLTFSVLNIVGFDFGPFFATWFLPFALPGALLIAAWLVEAKKSTIENIAPVLARVFTPLAAVMLLAMLVGMLVGEPLTAVDRELLILMDAVLLLVLFLLLYSISARDPQAPAGIFDRLQFGLVAAALAVDAVGLTAMLIRIAEFGFTANKVAALGLNLILLIHLAWAARLTFGLVRGTHTFAATERWQTRYLPVYAAWAAAVAVAFPPIFGFA